MFCAFLIYFLFFAKRDKPESANEGLCNSLSFCMLHMIQCWGIMDYMCVDVDMIMKLDCQLTCEKWLAIVFNVLNQNL